jgi:acetyl-CoA C-acetyltransferase
VETYADATLLAGARTPFVDFNGVFGLVSPTDLGIHAARAAIARSGLDPARIGTTVAGNCTQASFDSLFFARHIGLYAGMPNDRPAHGVQRLCTTGFEAIAQGAGLTSAGLADSVLCVGTESMSRAPIAAYTHRAGFGLGAPVEFKDFLWESLLDTGCATAMGGTAENLARLHGITREETDAYAAESFDRALKAQQAGRLAEEIAPVAEAVVRGPRPQAPQAAPVAQGDRGRGRHPHPPDARGGAGEAGPGLRRRADGRQQQRHRGRRRGGGADHRGGRGLARRQGGGAARPRGRRRLHGDAGR